MDFPFSFRSKSQPKGELVEHVSSSGRGSAPSVDAKDENIRSVITAGERIDGNLSFNNGLKLDGTVNGSVEFGLEDGMLVVNEGALIMGDVSGPRAIIVGEVRGNLMIAGKLIILPSARIVGDIMAGTIQMHDGAAVEGRVRSINSLNAIPQPSNGLTATQRRTMELEAQLSKAGPRIAPSPREQDGDFRPVSRIRPVANSAKAASGG